MQNSSESNSSGLRKRSLGKDLKSPNLPLNMEMGFQTVDGVIRGTPSPSTTKIFTEADAQSSTVSEFRMRQQSFEIHIEDCDEEEMSAGSSDEEASRPVTPVPPTLLPDCCGEVVYKESTTQDFLQAVTRDTDGLTDVSEGESETEDENELPPNSVIKRAPSS